MRAKNIVITEPDYDRLRRLIESSKQFRQRDAEHLDALEQELERATVVQAGEIPHNTVTMNSRVRVRDLNDGREMTYQIVFPGNADLLSRASRRILSEMSDQVVVRTIQSMLLPESE